MNRTELRERVVAVLETIAPEADYEALEPDEDLRDALDIDSMDHLKFVSTLGTQLEVEIPEKDYAQLATLDGAVTYLQHRLG